MMPIPDTNRGSKQPLYNIGVVARMTGVSMATLRAWERRYNFPDSERTAGGHRLYSERDVLRLRWVKDRIDDGMQTAQAIHALRHHEKEGGTVLLDPPVYRGRSIDIASDASASPHLPLAKDKLVEALITRDLGLADTIMSETLALSSPEDLILEVMGPTLAAIGDAWENGRINVATEHLATNYLRQRLLMWMVSGPPPRSVNPILLACAPDEWHEGSLLVLGAILRRRRWPIAYLGQAVPLPDLANFVSDIQPSLIVLVAMTEITASFAADWPRWLNTSGNDEHTPVCFGGRIFVTLPEWRSRMPGRYLGDTFQEGLISIENLLESRGY